MRTIYSASDVARELGTSIPRVTRAVRRLNHTEVVRRAGNRVSISESGVRKLRKYLGVTPTIEGFSPVQIRVLAALAKSPLGVASFRVLGNKAGVAPNTAKSAFLELEKRGLAMRQHHWVAAGCAIEKELLFANVMSPSWPNIAPKLTKLSPPMHRLRKRYKRVPPYLRHLFWNTAWEQMEIKENGPYIAKRLLATGDVDGIGWGAAHLSASDWKAAANERGLKADMKALATNLAGAAQR